MKNVENLGKPLSRDAMKTVFGGGQWPYTLWYCTLTPPGYGPYVCNETAWGDPSGGSGSCEMRNCTNIGDCYAQSPLCPID